MAERSFLSKLGIVRNAIRKDILYFFIPWITVMAIELLFSAWDLTKQPQNLIGSTETSIIGLALLIIGFILLVVGQLTLFRNYSSLLVIHKDHQLITHGIYRFTRNPMYLGVLMFLIGFPVLVANLYSFLTSLVLIPIFLNRIRMEERMLAEYFQDSFQKYKSTTKKLIPFIY
ncbi:methyltransferase family protein [Chloroflexota bacterium]